MGTLPCEDYEHEAIQKLQEKISLIDLERSGRGKDLDFYRERARRVFGLLMRAGFRAEADENSKFMPCSDDVEFLKAKDPALCTALRSRGLVTFCNILHPVPMKASYQLLDDKDIEDILERKDSIFHLHGNRLEDDAKEFIDLRRRARVLSKEIIDNHLADLGARRVNVHLLDGHGRMLVCLIRALTESGIINLADDARSDSFIKLNVFEIDDQVHSYHQYVFPKCVIKTKESIISNYILAERSVVYLNFCSIKSARDDEAWKDHFENQLVKKWVPHCYKENVLRYIWMITHPPLMCTVMVSLVIKDAKEEDSVYHDLLRRTLGNYITGLGFLYLLRQQDLFDAEIVSVRPGDGIVWDDSEKRKPKRVKSGKWGHPFVTLLVKPKDNDEREELSKLQEQFDEWDIANLREEMQRGATVEVVDGKYKGWVGTIAKRTVAMLHVRFDGMTTRRMPLGSCVLQKV